MREYSRLNWLWRSDPTSKAAAETEVPDLWQIRHPPNRGRLTALEKKVLARVEELGVVHPDVLRAELGKGSARNAWGGQSSRVKLALESLHSRGLVRVAQRRGGVRLYALCPPLVEPPSAEKVSRLIAVTVVQVLTPAPEPSVRSILARLGAAGALAPLVAEGTLEREVVSGLSYLRLVSARAGGVSGLIEPPERLVRFLAPFDPLVWDRRRFEQLWGWPYRFEAYTPPGQRVRGYYAMPLIYGDDVIGWANVESKRGQLDVELGFARSRPRGREFRIGVDAELERLRRFLGLRCPDAPVS